jgi:hypothetical protein
MSATLFQKNMSHISMQLYIRIRGQRQGPFDDEQLRSLIRRGVLARVHEVSEDGRQWIRADAYSDLFVSAVPVTVETEQASPVIPLDEPATPLEAAGYYYRVHGERTGPVSAGHLQALLDARQLVAGDVVWREGWIEWRPIHACPELASSQFSLRAAGGGAAPAAGGPRLSVFAVAGFVASLLWIAGLGSVAGLVLGCLAERQISSSRGQLTGYLWAVAAICLGVLGLAAAALLGVVMWRGELASGM